MVSMKLISPSHLCPVLGYSAARTSPFLGVSVCVCVCMYARRPCVLQFYTHVFKPVCKHQTRVLRHIFGPEIWSRVNLFSTRNTIPKSFVVLLMCKVCVVSFFVCSSVQQRISAQHTCLFS